MASSAGCSTRPFGTELEDLEPEPEEEDDPAENEEG
jgi:hypothetical protein